MKVIPINKNKKSNTFKNVLAILSMTFVVIYIAILVKSVAIASVPAKKEIVSLVQYVGGSPLTHGTAFKINYKGYIITANHVCKDETEVLVMDKIIKVLYKVPELDLCVLDGSTVTELKPLIPFLEIPRNGQEVQVVGFPLYHVFSPITEDGRVAGTETWEMFYSDAKRDMFGILTTAAVRHGNSGGPLILKDTDQVVGVIIATEYSTNYGLVVPMGTIMKNIKEAGL